MQNDLIPAPIDWVLLMPMLIVFGSGVVGMCIEMLRPRQNNNAIVLMTLVGLAAAGAYLIGAWDYPVTRTLGDLFLSDRTARVLQLLIIVISFTTVLYSEGYLRERRLPFGEYYPLVVWSATGAMIMATTTNLLIVFLGLEVLSIALYILAGLSNREQASQEAALKYFLLGAFASAFLLYGISLLYGATGTTQMEDLRAIWNQPLERPTVGLLYAGLTLVLVGFGFKVALVPFHMWTPDVYQGAPTSVTGYMAAAAKVGAFAALLRFLTYSIPMSDAWVPMLSVLALLTMTVGNLVALVQKDVKRILAYSSIAHAGYVLVALIAYGVLARESASAQPTSVLYYLIAYSFMTVGAFAVVSLATRGGRERTELSDLYGLWERAPLPAAMMIVFMASLAGIPLTAGFLGKLLIFRDALDAGLIVLAIALAINSVISAYYYLRIVLATVVQKPTLHAPRFAKPNAGLLATCLVCGLAIFALFFAAQPVLGQLEAPKEVFVQRGP
jgi:NADH-quinone oxidoreductase subunit N